MKRRMGKLMTAFVATICTIMAISTSVSACAWFYYQPEEPKCLRK